VWTIDEPLAERGRVCHALQGGIQVAVVAKIVNAFADSLYLVPVELDALGRGFIGFIEYLN